MLWQRDNVNNRRYMHINRIICLHYETHDILRITVRREDTTATFRERLVELIERSRLSQSAFAAKVGLDRSTLSQLLSPRNERLPRAENIVAIAAAEHVSIDWLLGLTKEGRLGTDVLRSSVEIERGGQSPADERLERWHQEAMGY